MKRLLLVILLGALLAFHTSAADENPSPFSAILGSRVDIIHEPILASELPAPGANLVLKIKLTNTRDTERPLRTLIVRDGRLSDTAPSKIFLDEYDQPTYEISTTSPLAEISYQFVLQNPDKTFSSTQRFTLRRGCIPRVDTTGLDLEATHGDERIGVLVKTAEGLAREVQNYDTLQKLVEELSQALQK